MSDRVGTHQLLEIDPSHPELDAAVTVLRALRSHRSLAELRALFVEGYENSGYRLTALIAGDQIRAIAGYRVLTNAAAGRHLYVDDLVTLPEERSNGYGRLLLTHLAERARSAGCSQLMLDSGTQRVDAHRFYFREGLVVTDFHFRRELGSA